MSQDIVNEVYFLLSSMIMGIIITFVYDFILIGRQVIKHSLFVISLEDFIFWAVCAITVFYMLYEENNGILRWFAVLGAAIGMLVYKKIIGRHYVKLMSILLKKEIYLAGKAADFLFRPIRFIIGKLKGYMERISLEEKKLLKYAKKKLTVFIKMLKIILCKH